MALWCPVGTEAKRHVFPWIRAVLKGFKLVFGFEEVGQGLNLKFGLNLIHKL